MMMHHYCQPLIYGTGMWSKIMLAKVSLWLGLWGCLSRGSSKLHPSLPTRGGRLRTASVSEVHLDLVRVSTGMTL